MKMIIIALVAALVFVPVSSMASYQNGYCPPGTHFEKGDPSAARGSIYDMANYGECVSNPT